MRHFGLALIAVFLSHGAAAEDQPPSPAVQGPASAATTPFDQALDRVRAKARTAFLVGIALDQTIRAEEMHEVEAVARTGKRVDNAGKVRRLIGGLDVALEVQQEAPRAKDPYAGNQVRDDIANKLLYVRDIFELKDHEFESARRLYMEQGGVMPGFQGGSPTQLAEARRQALARHGQHAVAGAVNGVAGWKPGDPGSIATAVSGGMGAVDGRQASTPVRNDKKYVAGDVYQKPGWRILQTKAPPSIVESGNYGLVDLHPKMLPDSQVAGKVEGHFNFATEGAVTDINNARNAYYNRHGMDASNKALDYAEHRYGMYQLSQGFSAGLPANDPVLGNVKKTADMVVGSGATIAYNTVFGLGMGMYQAATGEDPGGLGLAGHWYVGVAHLQKSVVAFVSGNDEKAGAEMTAARNHFDSGWADVTGDIAGVRQRLEDDERRAAEIRANQAARRFMVRG